MSFICLRRFILTSLIGLLALSTDWIYTKFLFPDVRTTQTTTHIQRSSSSFNNSNTQNELILSDDRDEYALHYNRTTDNSTYAVNETDEISTESLSSPTTTANETQNYEVVDPNQQLQEQQQQQQQQQLQQQQQQQQQKQQQKQKQHQQQEQQQQQQQQQHQQQEQQQQQQQQQQQKQNQQQQKQQPQQQHIEVIPTIELDGGHWEHVYNITPPYQYTSQLCAATRIETTDCKKTNNCPTGLMDWVYVVDDENSTSGSGKRYPKFDVDSFCKNMHNKRILFLRSSLVRQQVQALVWTLGHSELQWKKSKPAREHGFGSCTTPRYCMLEEPSSITICY
jgi:DNA polymerase III alpha subunit (gram-positive type)